MPEFTGKIKDMPTSKIKLPKQGSIKYKPSVIGEGWVVNQLKSMPAIKGQPPGEYSLKTGSSINDGDDAAIKAARVAAIKKANLSNKIYNVSSDTTASVAEPAVASILYGGGGGSGYQVETSAGGFSLSDIPSVVWIILAVGAGWFLIKSSSGKGKLF